MNEKEKSLGNQIRKPVTVWDDDQTQSNFQICSVI